MMISVYGQKALIDNKNEGPTLAGLPRRLCLGMLGQASDGLMGGQRTMEQPPSGRVEKVNDSNVMEKERMHQPQMLFLLVG